MPGGFAQLYKVLTAFEDAGRCQRGYFVESLGGAQFAVASTVDRLRSYLDSVDPDATGVPGGGAGRGRPGEPVRRRAALAHVGVGDAAHRPGRKAGALVVLVDGELAWFLERGGRSLLNFTDDPEAHHAAAGALADWSPTAGSTRSSSSAVDGVPVLEPPVR